MSEFNVGASSYVRLSKEDLIKAINRTFPESSREYATIAVLTTCESEDKGTGEKFKMQSLTFGKPLEV